MQIFSDRETRGPAARFLILLVGTVLVFGAVTAWVAVTYSSAGTVYWPAYSDMMASMPSPLAWLRWVLGDISEFAFYKHELASLGLSL